MKKLFLFTLTVILSLSLSARENPFEVTNSYEEEEARIIELNEIDQNAYDEQQFVKEMEKKMNEPSSKVEEVVEKLMPALETKKPEEKKYSKTEVNKLIKKAQKQTEVKTRNLIKKEISKTTMIEPKQVVYVKPRTDIIDEDPIKMKKILPFLEIKYNNNQITIHTEYKVLKKFTLEKDNKIIIDYKAKTNFYTKREMLDSLNFKKIAIGNHKNDKFFRVVLKVSKKPSNYKVNYKEGLISIVELDKM